MMKKNFIKIKKIFIVIVSLVVTTLSLNLTKNANRKPTSSYQKKIIVKKNKTTKTDKIKKATKNKKNNQNIDDVNIVDDVNYDHNSFVEKDQKLSKTSLEIKKEKDHKLKKENKNKKKDKKEEESLIKEKEEEKKEEEKKPEIPEIPFLQRKKIFYNYQLIIFITFIIIFSFFIYYLVILTIQYYYDCQIRKMFLDFINKNDKIDKNKQHDITWFNDYRTKQCTLNYIAPDNDKENNYLNEIFTKIKNTVGSNINVLNISSAFEKIKNEFLQSNTKFTINDNLSLTNIQITITKYRNDLQTFIQSLVFQNVQNGVMFSNNSNYITPLAKLNNLLNQGLQLQTLIYQTLSNNETYKQICECKIFNISIINNVFDIKKKFFLSIDPFQFDENNKITKIINNENIKITNLIDDISGLLKIFQFQGRNNDEGVDDMMKTLTEIIKRKFQFLFEQQELLFKDINDNRNELQTLFANINNDQNICSQKGTINTLINCLNKAYELKKNFCSYLEKNQYFQFLQSYSQYVNNINNVIKDEYQPYVIFSIDNNKLNTFDLTNLYNKILNMFSNNSNSDRQKLIDTYSKILEYKFICSYHDVNINLNIKMNEKITNFFNTKNNSGLDNFKYHPGNSNGIEIATNDFNEIIKGIILDQKDRNCSVINQNIKDFIFLFENLSNEEFTAFKRKLYKNSAIDQIMLKWFNDKKIDGEAYKIFTKKYCGQNNFAHINQMLLFSEGYFFEKDLSNTNLFEEIIKYQKNFYFSLKNSNNFKAALNAFNVLVKDGNKIDKKIISLKNSHSSNIQSFLSQNDLTIFNFINFAVPITKEIMFIDKEKNTALTYNFNNVQVIKSFFKYYFNDDYSEDILNTKLTELQIQ